MDKEYLEYGYIKLSRLIFKSKTFSSLNAIQKIITIYLILMANYKDKEWWDSYQKKFITIKRGSFITSIEHIKEKIDDRLVTTKKIRTCLKILKKLQFLAIERANRYSHITIIKYDLYQNDKNYRARQRAKQGQDKGKIRAINNNGKNGNNDNKKKKNVLLFQIIEYLNKVTHSKYKTNTPVTVKHINARLKEGFTLEDFKYVVDVKWIEWGGKFTKEGKSCEDWMRPITLFGPKFEGYLNQVKPDPYEKYYKKE